MSASSGKEKQGWISATFQARPKLAMFGVISVVGSTLMAARGLYRTYTSYVRKTPPEILNLPLVGSLFTMIIWSENFSIKLLPNYGDLVLYQLGPMKVYSVNEVSLANKVLSLAQDRPPVAVLAFQVCNKVPSFASINEDKRWGYRRRKMMHDLLVVLNVKQFSAHLSKVLKQTMYNYLNSNISNSPSGEYLWHPAECIWHTVFNAMFLAVFDKIFDMESKELKDLHWSVKYFVEAIISAGLYHVLPSALGEPLFGKQYRSYVKATDIMYDTVAAEYRRVKSNLEENGHTLAAQYARDDTLSEREIVADLVIVLLAGVDTSAHVQAVGVVLLSKYPEVQKMIFEELEAQAGQAGQNSSFFDLLKVKFCPIFRAFVQEALRIAQTVPSGGAHTCDKDIRCLKLSDGSIVCDVVDSNSWKKYDNKDVDRKVVYDYIIEKNSMIQPNLANMQIDSKLWNLDNDGELMNLNYWLNKDESGELKFFMNKNKIVFSAGARECPGQAIAMKQLNGFFSNLILSYKILPANAKDAAEKHIPITAAFGEQGSAIKPSVPVKICKRV